MQYKYPMLTEMEVSRKFIIDTAPLFHGNESLFLEHGFNIDDTVNSYLFNTVADISNLEELDEFILDLTDVLSDLGYDVEFLDKGYSITEKTD